MRNIFTIPAKLLFTTRRKDESMRRRELVFGVLLGATLGALILSGLLLCLSYATGHHFVLGRLVGVLVVIVFLLGLHELQRLRHYSLAACGLLGLYVLLATAMGAHWGVNLPIGILLYAVIIVLSGILLGARYSLYAMILCAIIVFCLQVGTVEGLIHPSTGWRRTPPQITDIAAYSLVFAMLGTCSWLFNRQTDVALQQALRAEIALTRQKELLEIKVATRSRELQAAQMEKMQQLYRFAQLGQFSTSLMHDLANHLSTLSIDIEGMEEKSHSQLMKRAKQRIQYIDTMVQWAYSHLNGKVQPVMFDVLHETNEVVAILQHDARLARVQLRRATFHGQGKKPNLYGDPNRFRQVIANLASNAIDAYSDAPAHNRREVVIDIYANTDSLLVLVQDWGSGISGEAQERIFEPFYSTKHSGMGIGLFVVKQIIEDYFKGGISLTSEEGKTTFSVTFPKTSDAQPRD